MSRHVEQLNYLAIELLEKLGNVEPSQSQIEIMESILSQVVPRWRIFDKGLTLLEIISILLAAKGKTSREIAGLLNVSQTDVEERYEAIKSKLDMSALAKTVLRLGDMRL